MDKRIPRAVILIVLLGVAAPLPAQISSRPASVALIAHVEESVSAKAYPIIMAQAFGEGDQPNLVALHVLLDWRLRGARTYRVGYSLEGEDAPAPDAQPPGFFSLRQMEARAGALSFMSSGSDQPGVLGVWGNTNADPTGQASFLLAVPPGAGTTDTVRITIAAF